MHSRPVISCFRPLLNIVWCFDINLVSSTSIWCDTLIRWLFYTSCGLHYLFSNCLDLSNALCDLVWLLWPFGKTSPISSLLPFLIWHRSTSDHIPLLFIAILGHSDYAGIMSGQFPLVLRPLLFVLLFYFTYYCVSVYIRQQIQFQ